MPYTKEQCLWRTVLQKYKSSKCLWCNNEKTPYSIEECNNAWAELVEMAKDITDDADKEFLQKRIKNFRTVCQREISKAKTANKTGKKYQPKIYYYDIIKSVLDEEAKNVASSSVGSLDKSNNMNNIAVKEEIDCDNTKEAQEFVEEPTTKRPRHSPARILARRMAEHLEQMDPDQALIAEKIISDICVYGRLKQLNIESSIALK